jgi:competence protein ComGC
MEITAIQAFLIYMIIMLLMFSVWMLWIVVPQWVEDVKDVVQWIRGKYASP